MSYLYQEYRPYLIPLFIFSIALVVRAGWWLHSGTRLAPDSSSYLATCGLWLQDPFGTLFTTRGLTFAGFTIPMCAVISLPGSSVDVWITIQILLSSVGCVLVYATGKRLFGTTAGVTAGLSIIFIWDVFRWSRQLLSDSLFVFAVALSIWSLSKYHTTDSKKNHVLVGLSLVFLGVTRPFGIPIIAGWMLWDILPNESPYRTGVVPSRVIASSIFLLSTFTLFLSGTYKRIQGSVVEKYKTGHIYSPTDELLYQYAHRGGENLYSFLALNIDHIAIMAILKILAFLSLWSPEYSTFHTVMNLVTFGPVLYGGLAGLCILGYKRSSTFPILATPVAVVILIVAVTIMDNGGRYRSPVAPALAVSMGYFVQYMITNSRLGPLFDRFELLS